MGVYPSSLACMVFTSFSLFFVVSIDNKLRWGVMGGILQMWLFLCFFSVYMTKLYETPASELSIVALLHDYSFFYNYNIIIANSIKHLKKLIGQNTEDINNVTIVCFLQRKKHSLKFYKKNFN